MIMLYRTSDVEETKSIINNQKYAARKSQEALRPYRTKGNPPIGNDVHANFLAWDWNDWHHSHSGQRSSSLTSKLKSLQNAFESAVFKLWTLYFQRIPFTDHFMNYVLLLTLQRLNQKIDVHLNKIMLKIWSSFIVLCLIKLGSWFGQRRKDSSLMLLWMLPKAPVGPEFTFHLTFDKCSAKTLNSCI